jgi:hypothetical protein
MWGLAREIQAAPTMRSSNNQDYRNNALKQQSGLQKFHASAGAGTAGSVHYAHMNISVRRADRWRGGVTIALGCAFVFFVILFLNRDFMAVSATGPAHQLAVIETVIGATLAPIDRATARALGEGQPSRDLVVTSIADGGPADRAGIRVGDVVEAIDDRPAIATAAISHALRSSAATIVVNRDGKRAKIRLEVRPPPVDR